MTLPKVSYRMCDTKSSEIASTILLLKAIAISMNFDLQAIALTIYLLKAIAKY